MSAAVTASEDFGEVSEPGARLYPRWCSWREGVHTLRARVRHHVHAELVTRLRPGSSPVQVAQGTEHAIGRPSRISSALVPRSACGSERRLIFRRRPSATKIGRARDDGRARLSYARSRVEGALARAGLEEHVPARALICAPNRASPRHGARSYRSLWRCLRSIEPLKQTESESFRMSQLWTGSPNPIKRGRALENDSQAPAPPRRKGAIGSEPGNGSSSLPKSEPTSARTSATARDRPDRLMKQAPPDSRAPGRLEREADRKRPHPGKWSIVES